MLAPLEFTERVAAMKLAALGLQHDRLSPSQERYLASWDLGT